MARGRLDTSAVLALSMVLLPEGRAFPKVLGEQPFYKNAGGGGSLFLSFGSPVAPERRVCFHDVYLRVNVAAVL